MWGIDSTIPFVYPTSYDVQTTGTLMIAAVPEPEIYAMMLAGLGLMGFVARRRQQGSAA